MNVKKMFSLFGLAQKAGKIASGDAQVQKTVKAGQAHLLVIAQDASEATKKGYNDMASYYQVPCITALTKVELGLAVGKGERAALVLTDKGFSNAVHKEFSQMGE
ncbi:MAG: ribosomal L7Ae/L30e/S12e/Gadd45 family protein [Sporomusaceae bacterium]|nr:ribosomal L7Ae/L30e/S12e/Gadd45 family protein [Sporomusaceae bacterium]